MESRDVDIGEWLPQTKNEVMKNVVEGIAEVGAWFMKVFIQSQQTTLSASAKRFLSDYATRRLCNVHRTFKISRGVSDNPELAQVTSVWRVPDIGWYPM